MAKARPLREIVRELVNRLDRLGMADPEYDVDCGDVVMELGDSYPELKEALEAEEREAKPEQYPGVFK